MNEPIRYYSTNHEAPVVDLASALLEDLSQTGLLDSTIVTWGGEFGRTPKIAKESQWQGGRHHYGTAFSWVVAGGGFKGGHVLGASNDKGTEVKDRPVYPQDLIASMYTLLGIDPDGPLPNPKNMDLRVMPSEGGAGRLTEIM